MTYENSPAYAGLSDHQQSAYFRKEIGTLLYNRIEEREETWGSVKSFL